MGFKKILFGEKDLGLGLHERDFTRFWFNKYNRWLMISCYTCYTDDITTCITNQLHALKIS